MRARTGLTNAEARALRREIYSLYTGGMGRLAIAEDLGLTFARVSRMLDEERRTRPCPLHDRRPSGGKNRRTDCAEMLERYQANETLGSIAMDKCITRQAVWFFITREAREQGKKLRPPTYKNR